jgi:hypothetical protein
MKTYTLWIGLGLLLLLATCHCSTFGVASDQVESDSHHFNIRGRDYSGEEDDDTIYHYNRGGQRGDDDEEDERRGGRGRDDDDKKKPCHDDEPEEVNWDDSDYGDYKFEFEPENCQSLEDVRVDFTEPSCKPKDDGKCIEITKRKCFKLAWGVFKPILCPPKKKDNHRGHGRYD